MLEISSRLNGKSFSVDLDGVTFIDEHGKALLTEMDNTGFELTANGWRMCSFIQQIAAYGVNSGEHRRAWLRCRLW